MSAHLHFAMLLGLLEAVGRFWKPEEVPFVVELLYTAEDAWEYVEECDCFSYNPLWLFGVEHYAEVARRLRKAIIC